MGANVAVTNRRMKKSLFGLALVSLSIISCDKKPEGGTTATSAKPTTATAAPTPTPAATPTTTATTKAEAITPSDKEPFESLTFKPKADKDANGWPVFEIYNASKKTITFANLSGFAYDKDGKFVAQTKPVSWNPGKLAPGAKSDWDLKIGDREAAKVSDKATTFELCYDSIWFDGEAKAVTGKGCDAKRPMGGVKSDKAKK